MNMWVVHYEFKAKTNNHDELKMMQMMQKVVIKLKSYLSSIIVFYNFQTSPTELKYQ